jgi:RimJ/RimL family protein N-acetyltransferase
MQPIAADQMITGEVGPVRLRRFRPDDADDLAAGCNDPLTQRFLPLLPSPYTLADAHWWINEGAPASFESGAAAYAYADPATDRLIGGGGFGRIHDSTAEMGFWVAPWARRRGVATAAARAMAREAFGRGLVRLWMRISPENPASQRVALAAGFQREGVQRDGGTRRGGGRCDMIVWARLATDPDEPTKRRLPDLPGGRLTDGVIALLPLTEADVDDTFALRSLPDVIATSVPPQPPELASIARTCARAAYAWLAGDRADLTLRDGATGAFTGEIGLHYSQPQLQEVMIGYSMMPAWRGRGYATRAVRLIAEYAFEHAGVVRVIAGTAPDNAASARVLQRAGFQREGYQRARLPGPGGTRIGDVLFALLPEDLHRGDAPG